MSNVTNVTDVTPQGHARAIPSVPRENLEMFVSGEINNGPTCIVQGAVMDPSGSVAGAGSAPGGATADDSRTQPESGAIQEGMETANKLALEIFQDVSFY